MKLRHALTLAFTAVSTLAACGETPKEKSARQAENAKVLSTLVAEDNAFLKNTGMTIAGVTGVGACDKGEIGTVFTSYNDYTDVGYVLRDERGKYAACVVHTRGETVVTGLRPLNPR